MGNYSMPRYFQNMPVVGKPVRANAENVAELKAIEEEIHAQIVKGLENGKADADMNAKGQLTAMQRVTLLVDPGTWCPLNSLYNPEKNKTGTTSIVKGLGRVNGKWCVIIASDNKKHAGTWVPGQADNLLRGSDTAKRLRIPLIYLLECAGVELDQQEKVYPNRRGGGTPFYRNSELNQMGVPVIVGIHGTNPAGGGYHSISPTILIAHQDANMAVGGAGIVGGMSPKGHVDKEAAEALIKPGVRLCELDAAARDLITEAGYGAYFNHRLGHFIGQTDHEKGDVSSANTAVARPGMIFSIEPGVYLPGEFGVRVEDLVLVTETGCEVLNRNDKHWDVVGK